MDGTWFASIPNQLVNASLKLLRMGFMPNCKCSFHNVFCVLRVLHHDAVTYTEDIGKIDCEMVKRFVFVSLVMFAFVSQTITQCAFDFNPRWRNATQSFVLPSTIRSRWRIASFAGAEIEMFAVSRL